jgi:hypothetical protein
MKQAKGIEMDREKIEISSALHARALYLKRNSYD